MAVHSLTLVVRGVVESVHGARPPRPEPRASASGRLGLAHHHPNHERQRVDGARLEGALGLGTASPSSTLGIIPNGLAVTLDDGRRERFVVNRRSEWVEKILGAMKERGYRG